MSPFKLLAFLLLLWPVASTLVAAPGTRNPRWQQGEILSRTTIAPSRHNSRTRYVYRIKSGSVQYVARFDERLSVAAYTPLMFSVAQKHLIVQDADGSEFKASILKKSVPGIRR